MDNGIIITVNLPGRIGGSVSHTSSQTIKADISPVGAKRVVWGNREINHNDRGELEAYLTVNISPEVVDMWAGGKAPYHVKPRDWQKYSRLKRIAAYVTEFDRGYGVEFDVVGE